MGELKQTIYDLEFALANRTLKYANSVVADDFKEFGSSGNIFTKNDYLNTLDHPTVKYEYEILDFKLAKIGNNTLLATCKSIYHNKHALRSSIWQSIDGTWQIIFHQGTGTDK